MNESNSGTNVVRLFFVVSKNFKNFMRKIFEDSELTMPQTMVINTLFEEGEMKITDLSSKISLSNSTISGIIDRLERQQLVVRTRNEEDRRTVYVKVTPKFEEIHKGFQEKIEKRFNDLLREGTPEEINKIIEGLNTLQRLLNQGKE